MHRKADAPKGSIIIAHVSCADPQTGQVVRRQVWAAINNAGRLYRRSVATSPSKSAWKHTDIEYLTRFQNLEKAAVKSLVRTELEAVAGNAGG